MRGTRTAPALTDAAASCRAWLAGNAAAWLHEVETSGVLSAAVMAEEDAAAQPARRRAGSPSGPSSPRRAAAPLASDRLSGHAGRDADAPGAANDDDSGSDDSFDDDNFV